jgi:hypothetical protein
MNKTVVTEKPNKSFTVVLSGLFNCIQSDSPLDAANKIAQWLLDDGGANSMVYEVEDEQTGEKFTVDLEDEDAVLPN